MRIGTLARRLGITPNAIRFYEQRGLLPEPGRGTNRYRELRRRMSEMRFLDERMAHLAGQLDLGVAPRTLIGVGKEDEHVTAL